jgi:hypothetical protein
MHILLSFQGIRKWRKEFVGTVNEEVAYLEVLSSSDKLIFIDTGRHLSTVKSVSVRYKLNVLLTVHHSMSV